MDAHRNNRFNAFYVDTRKPRVDNDIKVTISRVYSACVMKNKCYVSLSDIVNTIRINNGKSVVPSVHGLVKDIEKARQNGYIEIRRGKCGLTSNGISISGEIHSELEHMQGLEIKGIRYRIS